MNLEQLIQNWKIKRTIQALHCTVLLFEKHARAVQSAAFQEALQALRCCFTRYTALSIGGELHWIVHYVAFLGRPSLSLSLALRQDFAETHAEPASLDNEWM